jgi:hypothetical protein
VVQLHPGNGRSNLNHWFAEADSIVRAHEVGHALGLQDEYIDPACPSRKTAQAPGIFRDHSLMGNFFKEGIEHAELKPRHGELLAKQISESIGIAFSVRAQTRIPSNEADETNAERHAALLSNENRTQAIGVAWAIE